MSDITLSPFEEHLVNYVNKWKGVALEHLQVRFRELGNLDEALDKLITDGILRRAEFDIVKQTKQFILPCEARFTGWR